MNCPNCGAGLRTVPNRNHLRCPYCDSVHFPEPIGEGVVLLAEGHPFDCPCCDRPLAGAALDGDTVGYCPECHGLLLSSDHLARVLARRRETHAIRHRAVEPIDPTEFRRVMRCPRCRRKTETHTYGAGGPAVIDSCSRCRLVWLDAGELTVLQEYPARPRPAPVASLWLSETPSHF
jgi:Zn-finger nucleic acid-binding protein